MLEASFSSHNFTFGQYQNVFQFLVNSVTELSTTADPQSRPGAARRAHARSAAVRGARPVGRRRRRDGAARGARLGARHAGRSTATSAPRCARSRMLNGRLGAQALTRMMNYDPGAPRHADPPPEPGRGRPDDARLQGPRAQADGVVRAPRPGGLRPQHRAVRARCRRCRTSRSTTTPSSASAARSPSSSARPGCVSATRATRCCSRSARARRSRCPVS